MFPDSRLFEENKELLHLFDAFKHLETREAQEESEELKEHAEKVMGALDEAIDSLENVDPCIDFLRNVGRRHTKIPGFKAEYFWVRYISLSILLTRIYPCNSLQLSPSLSISVTLFNYLPLSIYNYPSLTFHLLFNSPPSLKLSTFFLTLYLLSNLFNSA